MSTYAEPAVSKPVDSIQQRLTSYACALDYDQLSPEAIHAAKVRVIDTLGVLIAGYDAEPSRIARILAAEMPHPSGATVIGSRMKTSPDLAAFANATAARYWELTDAYHWPGAFGGHASDVLTPVLAAAEYAQASGRDFITAAVLAYEVYLRFNDIFDNFGFDHTNMCCLATAMAAGKLLRLSPQQMSHCISMAIVPNVALRVSRMGQLSMWKAAATGQAGRAGIFAAQLARAGMEGPHLPFEGKSGWCDHVALKRLTLDTMGGNGTPFKILHTSIKMRPSIGLGVTLILATEKISPLNMQKVKHVLVELNRRAKNEMGTGAYNWSPETKETADHSAAYLAGVTMMDGTVTPRSYDEAHLRNPQLHALMQKIEVVENEEFTRVYVQAAVQRARVTVEMENGERLLGESGGDKDNLSAPKSDAQIVEKFHGLTEDALGAARANSIVERLWGLEKIGNAATIPPDFVLE